MLVRKRNSADLANLIEFIKLETDKTVGDEEFLVFSRNIIAAFPYEGQDQLSAILDFVRSHVQYQPDPDDTELFTSARRMMELVNQGSAFGDCDDMAIFCTAICRALGYQAHVVLLDQSGNGYNHAATEVYSDSVKEKYYMDATRPERIAIASPKMRDEPGSEINLTPHYVLKLEVR